MDKIYKTIKKGVLNNKAYTLKPINCPIKLNQNESPFDVPDQIKKDILDRLFKTKWNIYPDFTPQLLYKKVASYYNTTPENILIGNGSNEMIFTILAATVEKNKKVIIPEPTFTIYKLISSNLNGKIKSVMLNEDFSFNEEKIIRESSEKGSITIISSPNNPTGTYLKREYIEEIIKSSNGIVVVDEAYIHFGGESVIDLCDKYNNLIVLRTFSKAFGLAGLRIGVMISNKELILQLGKVKLPYNINIFTQITLNVILDNIEYIENNIKYIINQREILFNKMQNLPKIKVIPSSTNFLCIKTENSKFIFNELLKEGILVRDVSNYPMLDNCLRISVGNEYENNKLIEALLKILK
ncbi:MAG TPA: histidinol-phosphate transaminase [Spirochaetota bacterium]|nr:histidinol-phosphate transaminase [Spirochaetota bacterium]